MKMIIKGVILAIVIISLQGCSKKDIPDTSFPAPLKQVDQSASIAQYTQQSQDVYLDSKFPGIIRIKTSPHLWEILLDTTPLDITSDCLTIDQRSTYCSDGKKTVKIFLNDTKITSLDNRTIKDGDRLLLSFGDETGVEIERQLNNIPTVR